MASKTDVHASLWIWITGLSLMVSLCLLIFISYRPLFQTDRNTGIITCLIFILAGFLSYNIYNVNSEKLKQSSGLKYTVMMQINEPVSETEKSVKCIAGIKRIYNGEEKNRRKQKILVYFAKDSLAKQLRPGDKLICRIKLSEIPVPVNPDEFDYSRYLATKNVFNQTFVPSSSWHLLPNRTLSMRALSYHFRQTLLDKYSKTNLNPALLSILSAITLGYKSELDLHTRQVFSKAGVMHVMALSGFNVAVIAFAVNYLLFFFSRINHGSLIKAVLVILFIWLFAFITGLSPSVTRASLMISLVLTGKEMHRKLNVTNILYASAFILLAFSPALIYDLSFQLSFAAVFGIIIFQPALNHLMHFRIKIVEKIWQLFTVSLAAQFATMPLTLYYFHQFPVYFWITNLYVVPLVSVIICAAGVFLLVSFINPLMVLTGKILAFLVTTLYKSIIIIEIMPFAVVENIRINSLQLMLMLFILMLIALFIFYRRAAYVIITLCVIVLLQISGLINIYKINHQQILLVGHIKNTSVINLTEGRNSLLFTSYSLKDDNQKIKYSLGNFWVRRGISDHKIRHEHLPVHNIIFSFADKKIEILNTQRIPDKPEHADVLIITGKVSADSNLISIISPGMVVTDCSVPEYKARRWESICKKTETPCWIVSKQGAWYIENKGNIKDRQHQFLAGLLMERVLCNQSL
ncbi:MAG TPA: ComEC/Rec2 family competence protein [Bacteroidales bacterium]|nr:ComEC/Rec2 family competence protein [Bacteroidales bacterium]